MPLFAYSAAVAILGALTTNAVPPRVEADYLHSGYNYMHNLIFFFNGNSGSYVYNEYFRPFLSLQDYAYILYGSVLVLYIGVITFGPCVNRKNNAHD